MRLSIYVISFFLLPVLLFAENNSIVEVIEERVEIVGEKPLTIILDVDAGELKVERHDIPNVVLINMTYSEEQSSADIDYNKNKNKLRIYLNQEKWSNIKHNNDNHAECKVYLPTNIDLYVKSKLKAGELDMTIGGLRIIEFDLSMWAGEVDIDFDKPNLVIMEMLDIDTRVGEFNLDHLGNARFERADINGGIGEINVDFTGANVNDARAKVDLDIGEATIKLPNDVGIMMNIGGTFSFMSSKNVDRDLIKRGNRYYSENFDEIDNKFYLRVSPGLGELNIEMH